MWFKYNVNSNWWTENFFFQHMPTTLMNMIILLIYHNWFIKP
jgi:hypothetical protein